MSFRVKKKTRNEININSVYHATRSKTFKTGDVAISILNLFLFCLVRKTIDS